MAYRSIWKIGFESIIQTGFCIEGDILKKLRFEVYLRRVFEPAKNYNLLGYRKLGGCVSWFDRRKFLKSSELVMAGTAAKDNVQEVVTSLENTEEVKQNGSATAEGLETDEKDKISRIKRRKFAILLSYCGKDYLGMQRNPGTKTIEEDFFQALLKCGYIDEEIVKRPQNAFFQRAARTDKHVSAARQIVSIKLPETINIDSINSHLCPDIRVMGAKRVTKNFDSKGNCDARTYMYVLPTFSFAPIDEIVSEQYRITPDVIQKVKDTLKLYEGNKNFHNFTSRKKSSDPSAIRNIMSFTCSDPFIRDNMEYLTLQVKGQSFMLHQIRKMIGLAIALVRGFATDAAIEKAFQKERIDIPRAPGVGLMLGHVHYHRYDKRYGSDGMHETLTWDEVDDKIIQFCEDRIYPVVYRAESIEKSMLTWLATLPYHTYDVRESGSPGEFSAIGKAKLAVVKSVAAVFKDEDSDDEGAMNNPKKMKMEHQNS